MISKFLGKRYFSSSIKTLGVVGAGQMGTGIGIVGARIGLMGVKMVDVNEH
jgi:3-hydroxyacyl-CoA dehydrogenase